MVVHEEARLGHMIIIKSDVDIYIYIHIHIHIFTISPPGYLSEMDAAEWHHSGSIEELRENMRMVRNGYQQLLKLKEIPILDKSIWVINYIETFCLFYGGVFKGKVFELSCFLRALQDV